MTEKIIRPPKKGDWSVGCNECGEWAWWRPCFFPAENKGSFCRGVGYTSYYDKPKKACGTRLNHGCPNSGFFEFRNGHKTHLQPIPKWNRLKDYFEAEMSEMKKSQKVDNFFAKLLRATDYYVSMLSHAKDTVDDLKKENEALKKELEGLKEQRRDVDLEAKFYD